MAIDGKNPREELKDRQLKLADDPFFTEKEKGDGETQDKTAKAEKKEGEGPTPEEAAKKELEKVTSRSEKKLFQAKAVFPFDLFPDSISIDGNKIDIVQHPFFMSENLTTVALKEIMDVRVESAFLFGRLIIDYGPHPMKISTVVVEKMWKQDAFKAKEIIEGVLVLYRSENIDTTELNPDETMEEIETIGKIEKL